jgi:hypothetical protein
MPNYDETRWKKSDAVDQNAAVAWMTGPYVSLWYSSSYLVSVAFFLMFFNLSRAWNISIWLHFFTQFFLMHWTKGTPFGDMDQKEMKHLTFYEQLENGVPWTPTKKFLMLFPVVVYLVGAHLNLRTGLTYHIWHLPPTVVLVVAKLPELHRVRLFGINDKRWETSD